MLRPCLVLVLVGVSLAMPNYNDLYRRDSPRTGESLDDLKKAVSCKQLGQECWGLPVGRCCGETWCYKENTLFQKGNCVKCYGESKRCYSDDQCCSGLQCDKEHWIHGSGTCKAKREVGAECFENSQCPQWCERELFHIIGVCV